MAQQYHFVTVWQVNAPLSAAWAAIYHVADWPQWWPGMLRATKTKSGKNDWDNQYLLSWKSALPYTLSFYMELTEMNEPHRLSGKAWGELEGTGTWIFEPLTAERTKLTYYWDVATTKPWMNMLSFLLKPVFRINHDLLMQKGQQGLKLLLEG